MKDSWQKNNAVLIQGAHTMPACIDMLRLTWQRHAAYAVSHKMDYWSFICHPVPERICGAWDKVVYVRQALAAGYEYVFWVDTDAAIISDDDLRDVFKDQPGLIGAAVHDWQKLRPGGKMPTHMNVGVMYFHNDPKTIKFVDEWYEQYPPPDPLWGEQGVFNTMSAAPEWAGVVFPADDKYNSTIDVNMSEKPVVMAWHGVFPFIHRFDVMKQFLQGDWIKFRV